MKVFVTVGTTQFDDLIRLVCKTSILQAFHQHSYSHFVLQIGTGEYEPPQQCPVEGMILEYFRKKPSIREDMEKVDLIITHAGAGSLFESLRMKKKVIAIPNESLMGNHQKELADVLDLDGNVVSSTVGTFEELVTSSDKLFTQLLPQLSPLAPSNAQSFAQVVDNEMLMD